MRKASVARALAMLACLTIVAVGCNGDDSSDATGGDSSDTASESTSTTPPPPPPPPKAARCYNLGKSELRSASSDADSVPCKAAHTAQTYLVGTLPKKLTGDGGAVDSAAVADTVTERCDKAFAEHVGGDDDTRKLARVYPVWFVPTEDEMERGARWFRCDVTAAKAGGAAAKLPQKSKGMLETDDSLDRWGTCAPAGAGHPEAKATLCSQEHGLRAISVVGLGDSGETWPGSESLESRGSECESAIRDYLDNSAGALSFRWSYPSKEQWKDGRRYGLCWSDTGS